MRNLLSYGLAIALGIGLSATGHATPGKTLVLSVAEDGVWHRVLHQELEAGLRARGVAVADSLLTDTERGCRERDCLLQLGLSHGASAVLVATHYTESHLLDVFLFEVNERIVQKRSEEVTLSQRSARLLAMSASLLKLPESSEQSAPVLVQTQRSGSVSTLPMWRKGISSALGVLSVGALVTAVWAHGKDATLVRDARGQMLRLNMTPLFAPSYAVMGSAIIGMSLSLGLPNSSTQERAR